MNYQFLNIFLDPKDLLSQTQSNINPYLLENNKEQIEQIYDFYKSNINLLFINGYIGTGKANIAQYSTNFLSPETIVLKYNCFNSTVIDDILLSFFYDFKNLSSQNIISEPKIKTENFTQKINSYFSQIERPFVIILDSFEAVLDENRKEIIDFILHLNSMQKVKMILIGRTLDNKYFNNLPSENITTLPLEKNIFEKFLKAEKIKSSNLIIDEFYKHSRGYYFFTALSIKIMQSQNISLVDFLTNLKESFLPFNQFIDKEALKLVPPTERNLFWFLSLIRHPVRIDFLKKLDFYNEEKMDFLIDNLIVLKDNENIYVQDYLKDEIDESTYGHLLQKIRQYIIELYSSQLPLKPLERDMCISRQTMRKEIEYHSFFLPKKPKAGVAPVDINYLSYAKVFNLREKTKLEEEKLQMAQKAKDTVLTEQSIDLTQRKNININIENLPFQEKTKTATIKFEENIETKTLSFKEIVMLIKQAEKSYQYATIIDLCQKALSMQDEKDYSTYLPLIYTKVAFAYQKIAEYEKALKYYNLAKQVYENNQNFTKVNYIKFHTAKIFYETYKIEEAKRIFTEISESKDSPKILIVKTLLLLANLEEASSSPQNALGLYQKALAYSKEIIDIDVLSELYFKYALLMDDKNDIKTAIEFYNKCIELSPDEKMNKFLSPAYSNIATLYMEKNDVENAIENYQKAFEIDKKNNNVEGMYDGAGKLASILQRRDKNKALEFLQIALDAAKQINDIFYIISASLAVGDFYYDSTQNEIALKYYIKAFDLAQNNLSKDNINKIETRINDIKFRLGVEKFDNLVDIIREQNNE